MKKILAPETIKQMLKNGEVSMHDPETKFKHVLYSDCPVHHCECSVASFERKGGDSAQIIEVRFNCPICGEQFLAEPKDMYLI
jgi:hypothetical protein